MIRKFHSKPRKQKSKVSQDQVAWLMMELRANGYNPQAMKEIGIGHAKIQDNNRGQKKSS